MEQIFENIWIDRAQLKVGPAEFGTRMVVVRLKDGSLLLHSPIQFDETRKKKVDALGPVSAIISPVKTHNLFVGKWLTAYPEVPLYKVLGMPVLGSDPHKEYLLDKEEGYPWESELSYLNIKGMPNFNEAVFFHHASKTLLVSDLVFNLHYDQTIMGKIFLKLNGSYQKLGPSRLLKAMIKDKGLFQRSLKELFEWNFDHVIMAHGSPVFGGGYARLKSAFGI